MGHDSHGVQLMASYIDRIDKHPGYVFNFTGSVRYGMMKEYYPADYEKVKKLVAAGRWFPAGCRRRW